MLFLTRHLARNGVWKAAGAYVILSALFIAAAYGVVDLVGVSVLYARFVAVIAALGFPLALVMAWALGTPPLLGVTRVGAPQHSEEDVPQPVRVA